MSSVSSNQSLFSYAELGGRTVDQIRPSQTQIRDRKVISWTPVMLGTTNFPLHVTKVVHTYRTGDSLHGSEPLRLPETLFGGLILDMPLTNIKGYLEGKLAMNNLLDDDYLLSFLEQTILSVKAMKEGCRVPD